MRGVTQGDAQSIQYALADYFRYVAGHVAYEHQIRGIFSPKPGHQERHPRCALRCNASSRRRTT